MFFQNEGRAARDLTLTRMMTLFVALTIIHQTQAVWCDDIALKSSNSIPSFDGLQKVLDSGSSKVSLCSFRMEEDGCENGGPIHIYKSVSIMCESEYPFLDSSCLINCENTHFIVHKDATLTLDGITLTGTRNKPSIIVKANAVLQSLDTNFEDNQNVHGDGGAIYGEKDSKITARHNNFDQNKANRGGAIYSDGSVEIKWSKFRHNHAATTGGAVFMKTLDKESEVTQSTFKDNAAFYFGPAIFLSDKASRPATANKGCNNKSERHAHCDGIFQVSNGVDECTAFSGKCDRR